MTNEYELATVFELGDAKDVTLGEKEVVEQIDFLTLEFGLRWNPVTDD